MASSKVLNKLYAEYEAKRIEKENQFLTDLAISRFAVILGGRDAIESSTEFNKELQSDRLLKSDVKSIVRQVMPYIPALGILSGGITTSKHVFYSHMSKTVNNACRR